MAKIKLLLNFIEFRKYARRPCRLAMPHSNRLKKNLNKDNVVFVYLSIDKIQNDWLKANQEKGMEDVNNLIANPEKSDFLKKYRVNVLPRYLVIDENGSVLNEIAHRPSSSEIEKFLKI